MGDAKCFFGCARARAAHVVEEAVESLFVDKVSGSYVNISKLYQSKPWSLQPPFQRGQDNILVMPVLFRCASWSSMVISPHLRMPLELEHLCCVCHLIATAACIMPLPSAILASHIYIFGVLRGALVVEAPSQAKRREKKLCDLVAIGCGEHGGPSERSLCQKISAVARVVTIVPLMESDKRQHYFLWPPADCVEWSLAEVRCFEPVVMPGARFKTGATHVRHFREVDDPCLCGATVCITLPKLQHAAFFAERRAWLVTHSQAAVGASLALTVQPIPVSTVGPPCQGGQADGETDGVIADEDDINPHTGKKYTMASIVAAIMISHALSNKANFNAVVKNALKYVGCSEDVCPLS